MLTGTAGYSVYQHIFPNGKRYIGISREPEKRWKKDGSGYKTQRKMWHAIKLYGWENVRHEIVIHDINEEAAKRIEQLLIQLYDSINNGYNVSIGGGNINGTFLNPQVLRMINGAKTKLKGTKCVLYYVADSERYDPEAAGYWNESDRAVRMVHGNFSPHDELSIAKYWYYMGEYWRLYCMVQRGENTDDWEEKSFEDHISEYLLGGMQG